MVAEGGSHFNYQHLSTLLAQHINYQYHRMSKLQFTTQEFFKNIQLETFGKMEIE